MKIKSSKTKLNPAIGALILVLPLAGFAQTSLNVTNISGSFLSSSAADTNYGGAGTFAIAPSTASKGEFDSVLMFNTASVIAQFNTDYGMGNWTISSITISLASNFPTQGQMPSSGLFNNINGGNFDIDWLSDNSWTPGSGGGNGGTGYPGNGSVSFDYKPTLFSEPYDFLQTYNYTPPGNQNPITYTLPMDPNLVTSAADGDVSLFFFAATNSSVVYLFNSESYNTAANRPVMTLTATATPEPGIFALFTAGLGGLLTVRRRAKSS